MDPSSRPARTTERTPLKNKVLKINQLLIIHHGDKGQPEMANGKPYSSELQCSGITKPFPNF